MIRPNEITLLVLDDIDKWLNKYEYEEIELSSNKYKFFFSVVLFGNLIIFLIIQGKKGVWSSEILANVKGI